MLTENVIKLSTQVSKVITHPRNYRILVNYLASGFRNIAPFDPILINSPDESAGQ